MIKCGCASLRGSRATGLFSRTKRSSISWTFHAHDKPAYSIRNVHTDPSVVLNWRRILYKHHPTARGLETGEGRKSLVVLEATRTRRTKESTQEAQVTTVWQIESNPRAERGHRGSEAHKLPQAEAVARLSVLDTGELDRHHGFTQGVCGRWRA